MPAQEPQTNSTKLWHHEPEQTGLQPDAVLRGWLTEGGLLTARLRQACSDDFRLEVLDVARHTESRTGDDIHRTVVLHCGTHPCIYAETNIPAETALQHPWLNELGDEPLGERLESQPDVQRSEFRYAILNAADLAITLTAESNAVLWARQSDFHLGNHSLTVTEVFLPGIVASTGPRTSD